MTNSPLYLESTQDRTDRTREINDCLRQHGVCHLGPGLFVVHGINLPDHASLFGEGKATCLLLDPAVEEGYTVRIGSFCTLQNLWLAGDERLQSPPETVGTRHGLLFWGTATPHKWDHQPGNSIVSGCFMTSFSGGGITCLDTGYSIRASLTVNDCHILRCGAGIHIPHYSEYHRFTNIHCTENLYGCINNGGNNVFSACLFDSNKIGFMIDNTGGKSINNSHGSVVGCTFNHSDHNHGIGILLLEACHGYVFTGCQCFYSEIVVKDSTNILFSSFNFGRDQKISICGDKTVAFANCVFAAPPTVEHQKTSSLRLSNCYLADGTELTL